MSQCTNKFAPKFVALLNATRLTGVLYLHVHRATGVPKTDDRSKADPFVTVYYNGNEVKQLCGFLNLIFKLKVNGYCDGAKTLFIPFLFFLFVFEIDRQKIP